MNKELAIQAYLEIVRVSRVEWVPPPLLGKPFKPWLDTLTRFIFGEKRTSCTQWASEADMRKIFAKCFANGLIVNRCAVTKREINALSGNARKGNVWSNYPRRTILSSHEFCFEASIIVSIKEFPNSLLGFYSRTCQFRKWSNQSQSSCD